ATRRGVIGPAPPPARVSTATEARRSGATAACTGPAVRATVPATRNEAIRIPFTVSLATALAQLHHAPDFGVGAAPPDGHATIEALELHVCLRAHACALGGGEAASGAQKRQQACPVLSLSCGVGSAHHLVAAGP